MVEAPQPKGSDQRARSFAGHAATYAIGNIARRFVGFVMLPIYTRFLTPADYGVIGLLTLALAMMEPILGARLGWAVPKFYFDARDQRGRRAVIWGALLLTGAASVVSVLVLVLFRNVAADILFGSRKYALALGLFAISLLTQPIEQVGMTYLRLRERSGLFLTFSVSKLLLQLVLNLLLVVWWRGQVMGVVLSAVISSVAIAMGSTLYVAAHEALAFDWQVTKKMMQFCWPLWLSAIAGIYIGASGALFLRAFDTLSDVGRLQLALRFATTVGMLLWVPFLQHWEPMSFRYYKEVDGKRKFQVAFVAISALMFIGGMVISNFAEPVIKVMAAKSFYAAVSVVPILTLAAILDRLRTFFDFSFMITDRTKMRGAYQYATAAVITVAYVALIPRFGLIGAAAAQSLTFVGTFIYVYFLSRRYYDPEIKLLPIGLFSVVGVGAYIFASLASRLPNVGVDLAIRTLVTLIGTILIAIVALRAIGAADISLLESLPSPLDRLGRVQLRRLLGS
ncbi:MAG TPA: oligosaccharide flippase family protein [Steroidobacteraceae bacterium]|nr:oligosaccharide flippase family protein [Steroidobacteraceae bacterium]